MWQSIVWALVGYVVAVIAIYTFQRRLMYFPGRMIALPSALGLTQVDEVFFPSKDGTRLQAWVRRPREGFPTVVYFHGNAANLADRAPKFSAFVDAGFGLVAVSYRGFGKSEGRPSEAGLYNDARAAIDYALTEFKVPQNKLVYFGESMGTGVAVQMASERPPALLMLEAAYTSVETRSAELYWYILGVRRLVRDKYDSLSKIKSIRCPLLMVHGDKDDIIPPRHAKTLFAAANEPKELIFYPGVNHIDYTIEQITTPLFAAVKKYGL